MARFFQLALCTATAISLWVLVLTLPRTSHSSRLVVWPTSSGNKHATALDVASQIYVISLPRRLDRRGDMERLRTALGLQWTYLVAMDAQHPVVGEILARVREQRESAFGTNRNLSGTAGEFRWPDEIDALASSAEPLDMPSSGFDTGIVTLASTVGSSTAPSVPGPSSQNTPPSPPSVPLVCATQDNNVAAYDASLPEYSILSPEKIACWYSHLAVIRQVANNKGLGKADATLILEDDVDMEWDIRQRLGAVWSLLPMQWDIVFLGHCWSNESYYPALQPPQTQSPPLLDTAVFPSNQTRTHLHPSRSPKCTHAYVLSRTGARRILLHLMYPPFAYSRAIDQALMWLVRSERLKSFSVVPSVVVQRKVAGSDVMPGKGGEGGRGSEWKDVLVNGVFGT